MKKNMDQVNNYIVIMKSQINYLLLQMVKFNYIVKTNKNLNQINTKNRKNVLIVQANRI